MSIYDDLITGSQQFVANLGNGISALVRPFSGEQSDAIDADLFDLNTASKGGAVDPLESVGSFSRALVQQIPNVAANAAIGLGTLAVTKNPKLALGAVGGLSFVQNTGETYSGETEQLRKGEIAERDSAGVIGVGGLKAALDIVPMVKMARAFGIGDVAEKAVVGKAIDAGLLKGLWSGAVSEGVTEGLQTAADLVWQDHAAGRPLDSWTVADAKEVLGSALVGGVMGGATNAAGRALRQAFPDPQDKEVVNGWDGTGWVDNAAQDELSQQVLRGWSDANAEVGDVQQTQAIDSFASILSAQGFDPTPLNAEELQPQPTLPVPDEYLRVSKLLMKPTLNFDQRNALLDYRTSLEKELGPNVPQLPKSEVKIFEGTSPLVAEAIRNGDIESAVYYAEQLRDNRVSLDDTGRRGGLETDFAKFTGERYGYDDTGIALKPWMTAADMVGELNRQGGVESDAEGATDAMRNVPMVPHDAFAGMYTGARGRGVGVVTSAGDQGVVVELEGVAQSVNGRFTKGNPDAVLAHNYATMASNFVKTVPQAVLRDTAMRGVAFTPDSRTHGEKIVPAIIGEMRNTVDPVARLDLRNRALSQEQPQFPDGIHDPATGMSVHTPNTIKRAPIETGAFQC